VPRPQEDHVRAATQRLGGAHCGADPEPPRDVVRSRHHSPPAGVAADNERPRPERRVFELLDGREEGVEVQMREYRHDQDKATVRR
jgi:hypothetical protein